MSISSSGRQLQELLAGFGVAAGRRGLTLQKLTALSERAGRRIGPETWRRCAVEGALPKTATVIAMAQTLIDAGVGTTVEQLLGALHADKAAREGVHPSGRPTLQSGASPADLILSVIKGVPDPVERDKVLAEIRAGLNEDERVAWVTAMVRAPNATQEGGDRGHEASGHGDTDG